MITNRFDAYRTDFDRDGYVSLPSMFDAAAVAELHRQVDRFITDVVPTMSSAEVFLEDDNDRQSLKQIQRVHEHDDWFADLIGTGPLRQLAEALLNDEVVPRNLQYFNKPPRSGKATPAHQDGYYFMLEPCSALTMWLALESVDDENGCIRYWPAPRNWSTRYGSDKGLGVCVGSAAGGRAEDAHARENAAGVTYPKLLCGRTSLYSCFHAVVKA